MRKIVLSLMLGLFMLSKAYAGDGDQYITLNAGLLFQNTLNATFGYEKELPYDNAFEIFGEAGNRESVLQILLGALLLERWHRI